MKLLIVLTILCISTQTFALSTLDQGILYFANGASMGTFLANMEAETQKLQLHYAERLLKETKKLEEKRNESKIHRLNEERIDHEESLNSVNHLLSVIEEKTVALEKIEDLVSRIMKLHLTADSIVTEINNFREMEPELSKDADEIGLLVSKMPFAQLSSQEFESYLFKVLEIKSTLVLNELTLKDLRISLEETISQIDTKLERLK